MQTTQLTKEHIKAIEEELTILLIMGKVRYKSSVRSRLVVFKQINSKLKLPIRKDIYVIINSLLRKLDLRDRGIPL